VVSESELGCGEGITRHVPVVPPPTCTSGEMTAERKEALLKSVGYNPNNPFNLHEAMFEWSDDDIAYVLMTFSGHLVLDLCMFIFMFFNLLLPHINLSIPVVLCIRLK